MTDGTESTTHPVEGTALLAAGAKASVPLERLSDLLERVQAALANRLDEYHRRYECVHETDGAATFFVEEGHWHDRGESIGLDDRETDAVRRAHAEHLLYVGRRIDREAEFESALDVRETVTIGR